MGLRKDRALDELAQRGNVAQFVSFEPAGPRGLRQAYCRIRGHEPNRIFALPEEAISQLLANSPERSINIRSYSPENPRSREFVYGLTTADAAVAVARRLAGEGLFIIVNETVDITDGGVSGVAWGDTIEFAPDDTPRCVEREGVASLPLSIGLSILAKVYGFAPEIERSKEARIEFSIHPRPRGWLGRHTLAWEYERTPAEDSTPAFTWPNRFSRHIGDKAFGLLVAGELGVPVPFTTVFGRRVAPFSFGSRTASLEIWIRTCPREPDPGRYTTLKGWKDPFKLLASEDPDGKVIASVLSQAAVPARYSGAAIVLSDGTLYVEGRSGEGDGFMVGRDSPEPLPSEVIRNVKLTFDRLEDRLGAVRFEWVHDGTQAWVVQMHCGSTESTPTILVPGQASRWVTFDAAQGLEGLRAALMSLPPDTGIEVLGRIGLTSHLADLARKSKRPTRITSPLAA